MLKSTTYKLNTIKLHYHVKEFIGNKQSESFEFPPMYIAEVYLEPIRTSTMKLFLQTILRKCSIVDVRLGSKHTAV